MDDFDISGLPPAETKLEQPEAITPVVKAKQETKPPKKELVKSDMRELAERMKNRLNGVNFSLDRSTLPRVEFSSDFGDCNVKFDDTEITEVKLRCFVERGERSLERLTAYVESIANELDGKCGIGKHALNIRYRSKFTHIRGNTRYATLFFNVIRVNEIN